MEHFRLSADSGIASHLLREARILLRSQVTDSLALDYDPEVAREFDTLGADVAVPIFDEDLLWGVLTFSGKITSEPLTNQELELVYYLMGQLAQAIRNLHLRDRIASQQRFVNEVLAHVQTGVVVVGQNNRILTVNRRACELLDIEEKAVIGQDIRRLPSRVADVVFEVLQTGQEIHQREVVLPRGHRPLGISATRFTMGTDNSLAGGEGLIAVALIEDLSQARLQQTRARELADKEFFTRLAARLSHELKNSLVSIKIFAQLLPERHDEKEFREQFSTTVANEVNRVDVLVNNLTFFAHPLLLVNEEIVLGDLIDACVKNITLEFNRKQIAYVMGVGEKAPEPATGLRGHGEKEFRAQVCAVGGGPDSLDAGVRACAAQCGAIHAPRRPAHDQYDRCAADGSFRAKRCRQAAPCALIGRTRARGSPWKI